MKEEDYKFDAITGIVNVLKCYAAIAVVAMLVLLLTGCKTKYVSVPEYHYEYSHSTDTVIQKDSIIRDKETVIRETNKGDSALLASLGIQLADGQRAILVLRKEIEKMRNEYSEVAHDTIVKVDSVRVPYPVEGKVPFWEKVKIGCTGGVIAVGIVILAVVIWWLRKRLLRLPPS